MIDRRVQILDGGRSKADIVTVSSLRDRPFVVFLGEPGIGKTTVIDGEATAEGVSVIKVRELINETVQVEPGTLFLDALDEFRVGATDLDKVHLLTKAIKSAGATRWRLTCRSEDWMKSADFEAVKRTTGGAAITVAQILPLDLSESIAVLVALSETDPDAVAHGGDWPTSRFALFDQATRALALEENAVHRLDRGRANAESILAGAARASLFLLAIGSRFLWRSGAMPPTGFACEYLAADAFEGDRKDAHDLVYCIEHYEGGAEALQAAFSAALDDKHGAVISDALAMLRVRFIDPNPDESHLRDGPTAVALFENDDADVREDEDARDRRILRQRRAADVMRNFLTPLGSVDIHLSHSIIQTSATKAM